MVSQTQSSKSLQKKLSKSVSSSSSKEITICTETNFKLLKQISGERRYMWPVQNEIKKSEYAA
jgi:hypothetical protein